MIRGEMPSAGYRTIPALARAAGLSRRTIEDLLAGERTRYKDTTLYAVESALGWEPGSIETVLAGGKPRRVKDHSLARVIDAWSQLSERDRRLVLTIIDYLLYG